MTEKLAVVKVVDKLLPIEGADAIEVALVAGWQVVVKKGEFKEGDSCVFFQIDSFLPLRPEFSFLKPSKMGEKEGYRLKTIRLRKTLSQGLALPLSTFTHLTGEPEVGIFPPEPETDLTEILGVLKYEKPLPASLRGLTKGYMPSFLRKTDEERIQNIPTNLWEQYEKHLWYKTKKYDGSSMTVYYNNGAVGVCSRNLELKLEDENNTFISVANRPRHNIGSILEEFSKFCSDHKVNLAIQGELIGPGIQGNPHKVSEYGFIAFNIWDIDSQKYLPYSNVQDITSALCLRYDYPPIVGLSSKEALLMDADDNYQQKDGSFLEGFVYKSATPIITDNENEYRIHSFKVVSNKYLEKVEE